MRPYLGKISSGPYPFSALRRIVTRFVLDGKFGCAKINVGIEFEFAGSLSSMISCYVCCVARRDLSDKESRSISAFIIDSF
jgi:hypothetical protein